MASPDDSAPVSMDVMCSDQETECDPFPSQTSMVSGESQSPSADEQIHPDTRVQPTLYTIDEVPEEETSSAEEESSSSSSPSLRKQPSQLTLREVLAEGPLAAVTQEGVSKENPLLGVKRSVSLRLRKRVRSWVTPGKVEHREQKKDDDEQSAQSLFEAETSIGVGLDGSYHIHTLPSHPALTHAVTAYQPLSRPPPSAKADSQEIVRALLPSISSFLKPPNRGHHRNSFFQTSQDIILRHLYRARTSSSPETTRIGEPTATTATMSSSADDTAGAQRTALVCPAWDRRLDLCWVRAGNLSWDGARELGAFRVSLAQFHREFKHVPTKNDLINPLLGLPDRVRYMIAKYLVPDHEVTKSIKLNNGTWLYKPAWPANHFHDLVDVLDSVSAYTSVCWAMRADILCTILNTRTFHVVLSPFSGPGLDPLAHHWFDRYAGYIQHLAIELDCTKLGFGADPAAANLKPLMTKVLPRLEAYATAQKKRSIQQDILRDRVHVFGKAAKKDAMAGGGQSTVHSLTVAARRYFGERPAEAGQVPQKYNPDEYLAVLGPMKALCGKVDHVRLVGVDVDSAYRLLALVWEKGMTAGSVRQAVAGELGAVRVTCPSDFYPTLPGQASCFDDGTDGGKKTDTTWSLVRHYSTGEHARSGAAHTNEDAIDREAAEKERGARSSTLPSIVVTPASPKKARGLSDLASGRSDKGKGKAKEVYETEKETAPEWPEEREEAEEAEETEIGGSSTETEPFPKLPDAEVQLALLAAYEASQAMKRAADRCSSPERRQGEPGEEQMEDISGRKASAKQSRRKRGESWAWDHTGWGNSGGVVGRVAGKIQRKLNPKDNMDKS